MNAAEKNYPATWTREAAEYEGRRRFYTEVAPEAAPDPLDYPPTSMGQVLLWMDCCGINPTKEQMRGAQLFPSASTLREVLQGLGATDSQIQAAAADDMYVP